MDPYNFQRIPNLVGLSDRFRFVMAILSPPDTGTTLADALSKTVEAARVIRLDPGKDFTFEHVTDTVLSPMVYPTPEMVSPDTIVIMDATGAPHEEVTTGRDPTGDNAAWKVMFHRMNMLRNNIARDLNGTLILAMPPHMERLFAWAAPDFWSIRSLAVVL